MSQEVKLEAEKSIEPGPSAVDHEETETDKREDEMESSEDEDSEDDSDNPDDYHPVIFLGDDEPDDPYHEPTDVGYLVINHGPGKKRPNFKKDADGDYKCPETSCKYTTGKREHLNKHYKIHGEKQYECKLCAKKFAQRDTCMNHIRTHDDRYKFRCDECRKRFSVYKQLKTHCHAKHGIELESRRAQWGWFRPDERPLPLLPRMNSRGHFW